MRRAVILNDQDDDAGNNRIRNMVAEDLIKLATEVQSTGITDSNDLRRVIAAVRELHLSIPHLYRLTACCHDTAIPQGGAEEARRYAAWLVARAAWSVLFRTFQPVHVDDFFDFARLACAMHCRPAGVGMTSREIKRGHKRLITNLKNALMGISTVDYGMPSWHARRRQEAAAKNTKPAKKRKTKRNDKAPKSVVIAASASNARFVNGSSVH